jgi:hypothetical protein
MRKAAYGKSANFLFYQAFAGVSRAAMGLSAVGFAQAG